MVTSSNVVPWASYVSRCVTKKQVNGEGWRDWNWAWRSMCSFNHVWEVSPRIKGNDPKLRWYCYTAYLRRDMWMITCHIAGLGFKDFRSSKATSTLLPWWSKRHWPVSTSRAYTLSIMRSHQKEIRELGARPCVRCGQITSRQCWLPLSACMRECFLHFNYWWPRGNKHINKPMNVDYFKAAWQEFFQILNSGGFHWQRLFPAVGRCWGCPMGIPATKLASCAHNAPLRTSLWHLVPPRGRHLVGNFVDACFDPGRCLLAVGIHLSKWVLKKSPTRKLVGGFKYFLCSSLFGEDSHFG